LTANPLFGTFGTIGAIRSGSSNPIPTCSATILAESKPRSEVKIADETIREELSRMLESPIFVQSDRLARFLRFTVETTLAGQGEALKEYLIGTEVYDRKPPYHPGVDSIIRSEARRLRSKLREYYESVGRNDPIFIYYRPGSYVCLHWGAATIKRAAAWHGVAFAPAAAWAK
jgi:hypothetical protein